MEDYKKTQEQLHEKQLKFQREQDDQKLKKMDRFLDILSKKE